MAEDNQDIRLKCIYGNTVQLRNLSNNELTTYTLVTFNEEDLENNHISNYTEIGSAIWAKEEGDEVHIELPGIGIDKFRIESIENT